MILAQEQEILKGHRQYQEMAEFVRHASRDERPIPSSSAGSNSR
jgi:hypothetical protein